MAKYKECRNCGECYSAVTGICEGCGSEDLKWVESPYSLTYLSKWFKEGKKTPPTGIKSLYCINCGKWVTPVEDGSCPNCAKPECSYKGPKLPPNEQIGNTLDDIMEAVPSLNIEWNFTQ